MYNLMFQARQLNYPPPENFGNNRVHTQNTSNSGQSGISTDYFTKYGIPNICTHHRKSNSPTLQEIRTQGNTVAHTGAQLWT